MTMKLSTKKQKKEPSWVAKLITHLFDQKELHVNSKCKHYRNKITYNLPLKSLSPLAEVSLNDVCQAVDDWMKMQKEEEKQKCMQQHSSIFKEVMVKCVRDGSMIVRITIKRNEGKEDIWETIKDEFSFHLISKFPAITCICYNEAFGQARPTKDAPFTMLYGDTMYLLEKTPTGLSYQIGPDAFSEPNHEVEDLQYTQTVSWIEEFKGAILLCSGRDINAFSLGYGTILDNNGEKIFSEVIAVQHCPLVQKDAIANFRRHRDKVKTTVLHLTKDEMASGVSKALNDALERQNHPPVIVVTTGGRKGLDPSYVRFLKEHPSIRCIVYNSCSSKSLIVDMEGFMGGPQGYKIDNFRSYDFFAGTGYKTSLLRLIRRPRTLVLPVGPAGAGKSTLAKALRDRSPSGACLWFERDLEFQSLRERGESMTKSRSMLHDRMLEFLRGRHGISTDTRTGIGICFEKCRSVKILDSTNGNVGARSLYVKENVPELLILVVLAPPESTKIKKNSDKTSTSTSTSIYDDELLKILLERTRHRLGEGNKLHPSFPATIDGQRQKHSKILRGIEYPCISELDGFNIDANTTIEDVKNNGVHVDLSECGTSLDNGKMRKILLHCDMCDASNLSILPFQIFLEYSISPFLNQALKRGASLQLFE